jgi:hypothetical protein
MEIKETIVLNGPMLVYVEENLIKIQSSNTKAFTIELKEEEVHSIENIIEQNQNGEEVKITSDVLDVLGYMGRYPNIDEQTVKEIFHRLLVGSIQFIGKVSKEYNSPVIIQNTYFEKTKRFMSTIGLFDDIRIVYIDIEKIEKENENIC